MKKLDIQEYIQSGTIEKYVLGIATPEENAEVEKLAKQYPEIRSEINTNKFALLEYVMECQEEPPETIKDQVQQKLSTLDSGSGIQRFIQLFSIPSPWLAASLVSLTLSISFNIFLYSRLQDTQEDLYQTMHQQTLLAQQLQVSSANYQTLSQDVAIIHSPHTQFIDLKGLPEFPNVSVILYWDTQTQDVYLQVKNLPSPPQGKQYQLWSIDGKKVEDAGVFDINSLLFQIHKMKNVPKANAFAITLEKEGGVPVAEGAMYALGEV